MTFAHSAEVVTLKRKVESLTAELDAIKAENTELLMEVCALKAELDVVTEPPEAK